MRQHQARQACLVHAREARHVGVADNVGAVLVVARMRDRNADLVHQRGPAQEAVIVVVRIAHVGLELAEQMAGRVGHLLRLAHIHAIAPHESVDRGVAQVVMVVAPEQVV